MANSISAIDPHLKEWLVRRFGSRVRCHEPMSAHTSFKIGGPADIFVSPADIDDVLVLIDRFRYHSIKYLFMGGGTNLLVKDKGFRGAVISLLQGFKTITLASTTEIGVKVVAMSGVKLRTLCAFALKNGLSGFNFAMGIPGTIGGAIRMNAGTKHGSMADVIESIRVLNQDGTIESYNKNQLKFEYRKTSIIGSPAALSNSVILDAEFILRPEDPVSLRHDAEQCIRYRKLTQPIGAACAGCFFKNPPGFSAGWLIDQAGLKGKMAGGALVSDKHANFFINHYHATAQDVMDLAAMVQDTVYQQFGVQLETEVLIIGE